MQGLNLESCHSSVVWTVITVYFKMARLLLGVEVRSVKNGLVEEVHRNIGVSLWRGHNYS